MSFDFWTPLINIPLSVKITHYPTFIFDDKTLLLIGGLFVCRCRHYFSTPFSLLCSLLSPSSPSLRVSVSTFTCLFLPFPLPIVPFRLTSAMLLPFPGGVWFRRKRIYVGNLYGGYLPDSLHKLLPTLIRDWWWQEQIPQWEKHSEATLIIMSSPPEALLVRTGRVSRTLLRELLFCPTSSNSWDRCLLRSLLIVS